MTRILLHNTVATILIALSLSLPLFVDSSVTCLYYVPWFFFLSRANLAAAITVGLASGFVRIAIVLGPVLTIMSHPLAAYLIGATYLGILHVIFSVIAFRLLRVRSPIVRVISMGLTIVLLDICFYYGPLPADRFGTAYAIAGSSVGLDLILLFSTYGVGFPIGVMGYHVSQGLAKSRFRRATSLLLVIFLLVDYLPHRAPELWARTIKVICVPTPSIPGEMNAANDEEADLLLLPENIAKKLPLRPANTFDLPLESLFDSIERSKHQKPTLLGVVEKSADGYRNLALLYYQGNQTSVDKRRGIPGCEIAVFDDYFWLRSAVAGILPVESCIYMNRGASRVLETDKLRLAVNVCFDHCCIDAWRAWGLLDRECVDMLVCLAKLRPLRYGATWEWTLSRRARRIHAIIFNRPLLYISDLGSELVTPDGRYRSVMSINHHVWTVKLPSR